MGSNSTVSSLGSQSTYASHPQDNIETSDNESGSTRNTATTNISYYTGNSLSNRGCNYLECNEYTIGSQNMSGSYFNRLPDSQQIEHLKIVLKNDQDAEQKLDHLKTAGFVISSAVGIAATMLAFPAVAAAVGVGTIGVAAAGSIAATSGVIAGIIDRQNHTSVDISEHLNTIIGKALDNTTSNGTIDLSEFQRSIDEIFSTLNMTENAKISAKITAQSLALEKFSSLANSNGQCSLDDLRQHFQSQNLSEESLRQIQELMTTEGDRIVKQISKTFDDRFKKHTSLVAGLIISHYTAEQEERKKQIEYQRTLRDHRILKQDINTVANGAHLVTGILSMVDEEHADTYQHISRIVKAGTDLAGAFADAAFASSQGMAMGGPYVAIGVAALSLVQSFMKPGPTPEQLIMEQIQGLSEQIAAMEENIIAHIDELKKEIGRHADRFIAKLADLADNQRNIERKIDTLFEIASKLQVSTQTNTQLIMNAAVIGSQRAAAGLTRALSMEITNQLDDDISRDHFGKRESYREAVRQFNHMFLYDVNSEALAGGTLNPSRRVLGPNGQLGDVDYFTHRLMQEYRQKSFSYLDTDSAEFKTIMQGTLQHGASFYVNDFARAAGFNFEGEALANPLLLYTLVGDRIAIQNKYPQFSDVVEDFHLNNGWQKTISHVNQWDRYTAHLRAQVGSLSELTPNSNSSGVKQEDNLLTHTYLRYQEAVKAAVAKFRERSKAFEKAKHETAIANALIKTLETIVATSSSPDVNIPRLQDLKLELSEYQEFTPDGRLNLKLNAHYPGNERHGFLPRSVSGKLSRISEILISLRGLIDDANPRFQAYRSQGYNSRQLNHGAPWSQMPPEKNYAAYVGSGRPRDYSDHVRHGPDQITVDTYRLRRATYTDVKGFYSNLPDDYWLLLAMDAMDVQIIDRVASFDLRQDPNGSRGDHLTPGVVIEAYIKPKVGDRTNPNEGHFLTLGYRKLNGRIHGYNVSHSPRVVNNAMQNRTYQFTGNNFVDHINDEQATQASELLASTTSDPYWEDIAMSLPPEVQQVFYDALTEQRQLWKNQADIATVHNWTDIETDPEFKREVETILEDVDYQLSILQTYADTAFSTEGTPNAILQAVLDSSDDLFDSAALTDLFTNDDLNESGALAHSFETRESIALERLVEFKQALLATSANGEQTQSHALIQGVKRYLTAYTDDHRGARAEFSVPM